MPTVNVSQCTLQLIGEAREAFNNQPTLQVAADARDVFNNPNGLKLETSTILDATFTGRSSTPG